MKYTNLEIDHLFEAFDSEEGALKTSSYSGMVPKDKFDHVNQGTTGIFHCFEDNYFEYIWLRSKQEAETNLLRLDNRFEAIKNGGCPYGIALRGELSEIEREDFFDYPPKYGNYKLLVLKESLNNYQLPLIFVMEYAPESVARGRPGKWGKEFEHMVIRDKGIISFTSAVVTCPQVIIKQFGPIQFTRGMGYSLEIKSQSKLQLSAKTKITFASESET